MKSFQRVIMYSLVFLIISSCGNSKEEPSALQNTDSLILQWDNAWNSADAATVMALFTDDIHLFMDTVYSGKSNLEKDFVVPSVAILRNLHCVKIAEAISEDLACQSGSYSHDWTRNDSIVGNQKGYYSLVWARQSDQSWKISNIHIH
ncbi:MAG: DUF4440 domain-containing protein [Bacteroidales bacterium]|nr:DUF4440 domain-containing protein [Bacteroidales bacterium]